MRTFLSIILLFFFHTAVSQDVKPSDKKLFVYGGQVNKQFIKYTAKLTGKKKPKICFLPTATGDSERYMNYWYRLCSDLEVEPHVLKVWINSYSQKKSFEEILASMDAIIVGGGNTLNMLAIWKAQKIDAALKNAYDKGIVLAGGSAGSLCWFNGGTTDSRPKELSIVRGLNLINYSHCPHYNSEESRRPLYHDNILKDVLSDGYACDDKSGILFVNGKVNKALSIDKENNSYWVFKKDGKIIEEKIEAEIIE
ncbi:peptidase E [Aquimarina sp. MMG016]|uniref:Type 1 glutamine amidotransferase-like domain-containing protein n=1 Tax=Aquimarina sp. MMG016 TaxID=2822690 RepID=UPI001B3A02D7|nr:peptidase E [Aquimarina sp. MMG016]MBQ4820357.1 peptidase E [Aquimarina sp. MMG016]